MEKYNLWLVGFLQATGTAIYCGLISLFICNSSHIFGKITDFRGPLLFLILFVTSALLISGVITLSYCLLYGKEKNL